MGTIDPKPPFTTGGFHAAEIITNSQRRFLEAQGHAFRP